MRKGLGKGLGALLDSENILDGSSALSELKINEIVPNTSQPRKTFDQDKLKGLAESIQKHGVVQPIIVKKEPNGYSIIAGERRWRAARMAGLKTIPAIVKDMSSLEIMETALVENLQREDLNPIEEAEAYQKLIDEHGLTQDYISKLVGKSRAYIANSVRLLSLSEKVKAMIVDELLTPGHARTLITIEDEEKQNKLASYIAEKKLSVRETEEYVRKQTNKIEKTKRIQKINDPSVLEIEEKLKSYLGTKVIFSTGRTEGE